ncbi:MAG: hypothetical protein BWY31_01351 [Lentisphaerae bacterium ADurb.Bin242]|nr:MAG: hypothetical protein BWY31_01351 [Lentisphaerae bacterium ADurb.Bin242]
MEHFGEEGGLIGVGFREFLEFGIPRGGLFFKFGDASGNHGADFLRDVEILFRKPERLPRGGDFLRTERFTVAAGPARLGRGAEADGGAADDEGGTAVGDPGVREGLLDLRIVVGVGAADDAPLVRLETLADVFGEREAGGAFNADPVGIVERHDVVQLLVSGEGGGLVRDAFHHAAVAGDDVDFVVQQPGALQPADGRRVFGRDRHADAGGKAGSERTGGDFHARGMPEFRVAGGLASPLAELLEFLHRKTVFEEMKQTVKKHGAVSGGKNETVASEPLGVLRVVFHVFEPEVECIVGTAHGHSGVSGFRFLDTIRGKQPNRVGRQPHHFLVSH